MVREETEQSYNMHGETCHELDFETQAQGLHEIRMSGFSGPRKGKQRDEAITRWMVPVAESVPLERGGLPLAVAVQRAWVGKICCAALGYKHP